MRQRNELVPAQVYVCVVVIVVNAKHVQIASVTIETKGAFSLGRLVIQIVIVDESIVISYVAGDIGLCDPVYMSVSTFNFVLICVVMLREGEDRADDLISFFQNADVFAVIVSIIKRTGIILRIVGNGKNMLGCIR